MGLNGRVHLLVVCPEASEELGKRVMALFDAAQFDVRREKFFANVREWFAAGTIEFVIFVADQGITGRRKTVLLGTIQENELGDKVPYGMIAKSSPRLKEEMRNVVFYHGPSDAAKWSSLPSLVAKEVARWKRR